jgi:hypothetical protein
LQRLIRFWRWRTVGRNAALRASGKLPVASSEFLNCDVAVCSPTHHS